jgi:hypothetical protein
VLLQGAAAALLLSTSARVPPASAADLNTSSTGLQWKDVEEGTGPSPVKGATIK